jgi:hypothetical protein
MNGPLPSTTEAQEARMTITSDTPNTPDRMLYHGVASAHVLPPMFISTRLMAAYKIAGAGTLHIIADHYNKDMLVVYRTVIEPDEEWSAVNPCCGDVPFMHDEMFPEGYTWRYDDQGDEAARPLHSAVSARIDYGDTMRGLLTFLLSDGERWALTLLGHTEDADNYSFNAHVGEWVWAYDTQFQAALHELECGLQCEACVNEVANT